MPTNIIARVVDIDFCVIEFVSRVEFDQNAMTTAYVQPVRIEPPPFRSLWDWLRPDYPRPVFANGRYFVAVRGGASESACFSQTQHYDKTPYLQSIEWQFPLVHSVGQGEWDEEHRQCVIGMLVYAAQYGSSPVAIAALLLIANAKDAQWDVTQHLPPQTASALERLLAIASHDPEFKNILRRRDDDN